MTAILRLLVIFWESRMIIIGVALAFATNPFNEQIIATERSGDW